jgi:hypothetical protein
MGSWSTREFSATKLHARATRVARQLDILVGARITTPSERCVMVSRSPLPLTSAQGRAFVIRCGVEEPHRFVRGSGSGWYGKTAFGDLVCAVTRSLVPMIAPPPLRRLQLPVGYLTGETEHSTIEQDGESTHA